MLGVHNYIFARASSLSYIKVQCYSRSLGFFPSNARRLRSWFFAPEPHKKWREMTCKLWCWSLAGQRRLLPFSSRCGAPGNPCALLFPRVILSARSGALPFCRTALFFTRLAQSYCFHAVLAAKTGRPAFCLLLRELSSLFDHSSFQSASCSSLTLALLFASLQKTLSILCIKWTRNF